MVDRVAAGHSVTVTRDGRPVAELRPARARDLSVVVLLERWRHVPVVDARRLREDVDRVVDPRL